MICITSISPSHINSGIQSKAIKSWIDCGMKVFSMNCRSECEILKSLYPDVEFIPTFQTMELSFKKPYVRINAVLDWCKGAHKEHFCIINSDIELKTDADTIIRIEKEMETALVLANRVNYETEYTGEQYLSGIDVFFIHKKWLNNFAQTLFCFGQCFWDYWVPYSATQRGIELTFIKQNIAFHKNHNAQYDQDQWLKTGRLFIWEHNLYQFNSTQPKEIGRMSSHVYNYIYATAKRKEI